MTVKLDSLQSMKIDLELTTEHTKSLREHARKTLAAEYEDNATPADAFDAMFDAVFKRLAEWGDQLESGCCTACGGEGHRVYHDEDGDKVDACTECLGTGHPHAEHSLCPNKVMTADESWVQVHKRATEMKNEAERLFALAQYELRCPHRADVFPGVTSRCSLSKGHAGECDPKGSEAAPPSFYNGVA